MTRLPGVSRSVQLSRSRLTTFAPTPQSVRQKDIWTYDVLQITDGCFQSRFACSITELGSRRIVHGSVSRSPRDAGLAQQLRAATPFGKAPQYLVWHKDARFGPHFDAVALGTPIEVLRMPIKAPRANAICERLLGSISGNAWATS